MKKLFILFSLLLLLASARQANAQTGAYVPASFNHANVILVQTPDSANAALLKMGKLLVAAGYTIRKLDRDFGTLTTEPRQVRAGAFPTTMTMQATAGPQGLLLSAEIVADMRVISASSENTRVRIEQLGKKPSGYFLQLQQLAASYGAPLAYGKQ